MMDWFTLDKVKALIALCTFLAGAAGWLGIGKYKLVLENQETKQEVKAAKQEANATKEQVTTIVNYYYDQGCKPND